MLDGGEMEVVENIHAAPQMLLHHISASSDQKTYPSYEKDNMTHLYGTPLLVGGRRFNNASDRPTSFASSMADEYDLLCFRRFSTLGSRNILKMQHDIIEVEKELYLVEDAERQKGPRSGTEGLSLLHSLDPCLDRKKELLVQLRHMLQEYNELISVYSRVRIRATARTDRRTNLCGLLQKLAHGREGFWDNQVELDASGCDTMLESWDQVSKNYKIDENMFRWHKDSSNRGYLNHQLGGGRTYGNRLRTKKIGALYTLLMAVPCAGMLFSGMTLPGGMRTVAGVIATSASVSNVPLHMRSDYMRLRWGILAFSVASYTVFLALLWRSLNEIRRPAYLFFTFLSGAGFIGSALVADKIEDTVKAILTFAPLVATLSAGLLYMPFRYGFGIGANLVEDVEMQPPVGR